MYYMFIDESGTEGLEKVPSKSMLGLNWFTTAGIMVKDTDVIKFDTAHDYIMSKFFSDNNIQIPSTFKLHYHGLRMKKSPYDLLTDSQRLSLANTVFESILSIDCKLVSSSANKLGPTMSRHQNIGVRAYTLLMCMERFQRFLEEVGDDGDIIYERFIPAVYKKTLLDIKALKNTDDFSNVGSLHRIRGRIHNGDPTRLKPLAFSDFFAYLPHLKARSKGNKERRWRQIACKYYEDGFMVVN